MDTEQVADKAASGESLVYGPRTRWQLQIALGVVVLCLLLLIRHLPYAFFPYRGLAHIPVVLAWGAIALLCVVWVLIRTPFAVVKWLRPRLAAKVLRQHRMESAALPMVGIAPGETVRLYGGDSSWDIGFILLSSGRMRYLGDRSSFELRPDQVMSVDATRRGSVLGVKVPRILLKWAESTSGREETLAIELWEGRNFGQMRSRVKELAQRIEEWRTEPAPPGATPGELGLPPTEKGVLGARAHRRKPGYVAWTAGGLVGIAVIADVTMRGLNMVSSYSPWRAAVPFAASTLGVLCAILLAVFFQRTLDRR